MRQIVTHPFIYTPIVLRFHAGKHPHAQLHDRSSHEVPEVRGGRKIENVDIRFEGHGSVIESLWRILLSYNQ